MKAIGLFRAAAIVAAGTLVACGGDDIRYVTASDAGDAGDATTGNLDATTTDAFVADDTATPADGNPTDTTAPSTPHLLATMNNTSTSELLALDLTTNATAGKFDYAGFLGSTYAQGAHPYVLEQATDIVGRLDDANPWTTDSTWNVALNDATDGGTSYSDPVAVITAGTKGYVLRYTRNEIAVIDTSVNVDGGAPTKTVDLSSLISPNDSDGTVEVSGGAYVASRGLVYVVLGNIDRNQVVDEGYVQLCTNTGPTVIAIDTTNDTLVNLNGAGAGGGYQLAGYGVAFGVPVIYDSTNDRLLVLESGCNTADSSIDGGVGALTKRGVEAVSLFTGVATTLFDGNAQQFPDALAYIDAHDAVLGFGGVAYTWDPTANALGNAIANAPDYFVSDGKGNLVGTKAIYGDGGVTTGTDIVSVRIADGTSTTLASNPWTDSTGFVGGVDIWPHP